MPQLNSNTMTLRPVGTIKNNIEKPILVSGSKGIEMNGQLQANKEKILKLQKEPSEIIINEDMIEVLDGIEDYSHILVLYWAHLVPEQSRSLTKVHPVGRKEFPLVGIFGTCSPARPNPVLLTLVELIGREDNVLKVTGLDAVNGSPVIDIKPYVSEIFVKENVHTPVWMQQIMRELRENTVND